MPIISGGGSVSSSGQITDEIIQNIDIAVNAAIAESKLAFATNDGSRHDHHADDITAGTLPAARGGAGTADEQNTVVGVGIKSLVKLYYNAHLLFTLWTGSTSGALTTDFPNWVRNDATDVVVKQLGTMADFQSTGAAYISLDQPFFSIDANTPLEFNDSNKLVLDFFAKLPATSTGDISMGFGLTPSTGPLAYNSSARSCVAFVQRGSTGVLYANSTHETVGQDLTDISSGLTLTNWNHYRIELDLGVEARFYVNGTLKATLSGANLPTTTDDIAIGFARHNTALFQVTAPFFRIGLI